MLSIYIAFVIMYLTLYFFGYSVKTLLLNDDLKKYDLYMTPWMGLGVIIIVLYPLSLLGFSVKSVCDYFFGAVLLSNVIVYLKYKEPVHYDKNELIVLTVTGFLIGAIYGVLLAVKDFDYYAVFFYNADFPAYLNMAKAALLTSAKFTKENAVGMSHRIMNMFAFYYQFRGCVFSLAFFSGLFHVDIARAAYLFSAFIMFLNISAFRLFIKNMKNLWITCLIIGMICINNFYEWLVFYGFLGQLFSVGIILLIFYLTFYLSETGRFDFKTDLLIVFLLTLNGLNYLEALAYPVIPAAVFSICAFSRGDCGCRKALWKNVAFVGLAYTLLNLPVIIKFIGIFSILKNVDAAWAMPFATFYDIAGLEGAFSLPAGKSAIIFLLIPNYIVLAVLLHQMRKEKLSSLLTVSFISYFSLYIIFSIMFYRHGELSTYKVFKAAVSMSFVAFILLIRFLDEYLNCFWDGLRQLRQNRVWNPDAPFWAPLLKLKGFVVSLFFAAFLILNARGTYSVYLTPLSEEQSLGVTVEHEALKAFCGNPNYAGSDFILNCNMPFNQMMAEYYSPLGRTYTISDSGYLWSNMKDSFEPGDFYITGTNFPVIYDADAPLLFANHLYSIYRLEKKSILLSKYSGITARRILDIINGIGSWETDGNTIGLKFISLMERSADFVVEFLLSGNGKSSFGLVAHVNGEPVSEPSLTSSLSHVELDGGSGLYFATVRIKDVALKEGVNDISFELNVSGDKTRLFVNSVSFVNDRPVERGE